MSLDNLLSGVEIIDVIKKKESHSSKVYQGSGLFIYDAKHPLSIHDITSKGIKVIICQELPSKLYAHITYIKVKDLLRARAIINANLYDWPSKKLKLVVVTGTNGKTTVVNLLYELFTKLSYKVGVISTLGAKINGTLLDNNKGVPNVNKVLARMVDESCEYCFLEGHSFGMAYRAQLVGLHIAGAAILNVTHDHLDVHGSFENYFQVKKSLFDSLPSSAFALFNADDKLGKKLVLDTVAQDYSFGIHNIADFTGTVINSSIAGLSLSIEKTTLSCRLVGFFNAYNLLAAYSIARLLGMDSIKILKQLPLLSPIRGRIQMVPTSQEYYCFVDFAHNPDGLQKVLFALNAAKEKNNRLICVIGCGGNRDKEKRPVMARIAVNYSDIVIFTSDNPRNESPQAIIDDMKENITKSDKNRILTVIDRKKAIERACILASKGDFILIAGKGHEQYQEIKGQQFYFDDVDILKEVAG